MKCRCSFCAQPASPACSTRQWPHAHHRAQSLHHRLQRLRVRRGDVIRFVSGAGRFPRANLETATFVQLNLCSRRMAQQGQSFLWNSQILPKSVSFVQIFQLADSGKAPQMVCFSLGVGITFATCQLDLLHRLVRRYASTARRLSCRQLHVGAPKLGARGRFSFGFPSHPRGLRSEPLTFRGEHPCE